MTDVHNVNIVKDLFVDWLETDEGADYMYDIRFHDKGEVLNVPGAPFNWTIELVDTSNAESSYDSYGYETLENGFVVFSITDEDDNVALYKLPVGYASFEGSTVEPDKIVKVYKAPRVVMEWIEI